MKPLKQQTKRQKLFYAFLFFPCRMVFVLIPLGFSLVLPWIVPLVFSLGFFLFSSLVFSSRLFSLDFYTVKDSEQSNFLFSPRKENPEFSTLDLHDLSKLISRLQDSKDPVSEYFRGRFSSDLNEFLSSENLLREISDKSLTRNFKEQEELKKSLSENLVAEFNRFVAGPLIYTGRNESVFSEIELSERTLKLLEEHSNLSEEDQRYLNFFLIQESYPESIRAWNFWREDILPSIKESKQQSIQPNFRRNIEANELPYPYIEENLSEPFLKRTAVFSLSLQENPNENPIEVFVEGKIFPRATGDFYLYQIPRTQYEFGFLSGTIKGQKIAQRVNLNLFLQIENNVENNVGDVRDGEDNENQNNEIQGSLHLNIQEGRFKNAVFTLFARFPPNKYLRIRGSVSGTLENSVFRAQVWDVDGRKIQDLKGSFDPVQRLLFSVHDSLIQNFLTQFSSMDEKDE